MSRSILRRISMQMDEDQQAIFLAEWFSKEVLEKALNIKIEEDNKMSFLYEESDLEKFSDYSIKIINGTSRGSYVTARLTGMNK